MRPFIIAACILVVSTPVLADTRTGSANSRTLQAWSFFNFGHGESKITLSWTKSAATLIMILTCGATDPLTYGIAASGLDRYAEITVGVIQNTTCLVGVTSVRQGSPYRIHFNQTVSEVSSGRGRIPTIRATGPQLDAMRRYAEMELNRVRQLHLSTVD